MRSSFSTPFTAFTCRRGAPACGAGDALVPFSGFEKLLSRRYEEAIGIFLGAQAAAGWSDGLSSALAAAYRGLGFQTLADQVRRSVRSVRGNQWMFRSGHPADYALRIRREFLDRRTAIPSRSFTNPRPCAWT